MRIFLPAYGLSKGYRSIGSALVGFFPEVTRQVCLTLKGTDLVAIDPPGKYCPYYQRQEYRQGTVEWKQVQRFVSDEVLVI